MSDLFELDPTKPQSEGPQRPYDLLVIDGGGLATTAWSANRDLDHASARVKSGIYVVVACIASTSRLLSREGRVVVCWDGRDNRAWRRGRNPWYKHGRGSIINRQEVRAIVESLKTLLDACGIAQLQVDGREADDLVASVVAMKRDEGYTGTILMFSDDKDFLQLVDENTHLCRRSLNGVVLSPAQATLMDVKYGQRYLHAKAMTGDPGDNLRGLYRIGERKAEDILSASPSIVYQMVEDPGSVDWDALPDNLIKPLVAAGRRLMWPPLIEDYAFAAKMAAKMGLPAPMDYDLPESVCLAAAAVEAAWSLDMMTMDGTIDVTLDFPRVALEAIPPALARVDMSEETDLLSSLYSLARARSDESAPRFRPVTRAGDAVTDDEAPTPKDLF